jgi:hypothetical protein
MRKHFEYMMSIKAEADITVEDIGNCCLSAYTDLGFLYLLIIKTDSGNTEIIEYGPILEDLDTLPANVEYLYEKFQFSESKISRRISRFLVRDRITQVFEIEIEEAKDKIRNMVDYL